MGLWKLFAVANSTEKGRRQMKFIKKLPHYIYSMYYDIKTYRFVRKIFTSFVGYIVIGWITMLAMFGATYSTEVHISPAFPIVFITLAFSMGWVTVYYLHYYPMIQEVYKEIEKQDKYPFLYNRFTKIK